MSYNARVYYNGDGVTTQFAVPFAYINENHVQALVGGVAASFTWVNSSEIQFTMAPAAGTGNVLILRQTPVGAVEATIQSGTILPADINLDTLQSLYLAQEAQDVLANIQNRAPLIADNGLAATSAIGAIAQRAGYPLGFDGAGNFALGFATMAQIDNVAEAWAAQGGAPTAGSFSTTTALLAAFALATSLVAGTTFSTGARATPGDGGGATYRYDNLDTTSADNGGTIRVDGAGRRWKIVNPAIVPVEVFGAKGDNATDDYTAFNNAVTALGSTGTVLMGGKTYLLGTQLVLNAPVRMVGQGKDSTTININTANQVAILVSCNSCRLTDFTVADGKGKGGTSTGIKLGGVNPTGTNYITCWNVIDAVGYSGLKYGRILQITGADGECYENTFTNEKFVNVGLSIYHANPSTPGNGGPNANYTSNFTIFSAGSISNGGIYIQAGASNEFSKGYIEGMTNAGPLTNPTAIQIDHATSDGLNNDSNVFFAVRGESNTYAIVNANGLSEFYGCFFGLGTQIWTAEPAVFIGGDPSSFPVKIPGFLFQTNNELPAYGNIISYLTGQAGAQALNGPVVAKSYFATLSGTTGSIANNGTFTITLPQSGALYDLWVTGDANYNQAAQFTFGTDGSTNQGAITPVNAGGATITVNALTVTVTNTSGASAHLHWGLMQRTP